MKNIEDSAIPNSKKALYAIAAAQLERDKKMQKMDLQAREEMDLNN